MKAMKKILALAAAGVMVLSAAAMADVPTSQSIATNNAADADGNYQISVANTDTHTYTVYQILTGSLIAGENKLGNPQWGADAAATSAYDTVDSFISAVSASGLSNTQIDDIVKSVIKTDAATRGEVKKDHPMNVAPGYYFLVDTTSSLADGDAKSLSLVAVFNDIQVTAKKGTTTSEKHVDDQNDSVSTDHSELKDSADYDIGDTIPYTLTATLPEDYANYKQYYISFTDDMSAGLTYNGDAKIFFGASDTTGTDIGTAFAATSDTSSYTTPSAGKVYKYTIQNLKAADATDAQKALTAGSVIKITYTATLNENAVIGSAGNPNQYKIDFSSNPNEEASGTPETNDTPWDVNIVFTYKTVFNKVDSNNKPLTGADFTLYKKVVDNSTVGFSWINVTALHTGDGAKNPSKTIESFTNDNGTASNAKFTFAGLDAGDYKLEETTTPAGYNTIDPIEFTITAEHVLESATPTLQTLTGAKGAEFTMSSNVTTGELSKDIQNNQGSTLPSTGGMGTTIFYIIGAILVIGAGILLVSKKRMSAN